MDVQLLPQFPPEGAAEHLYTSTKAAGLVLFSNTETDAFLHASITIKVTLCDFNAFLTPSRR